MTLRIRLVLLFFITSLIALSTFAIFSYIDSKKNREIEFYNALEKEAITKADLYFKAEVPDSTLHAIYENNRQTIHEVEVAIYALPFELIYHDAVAIDFVKETPKMIQEIAERGGTQFYQNEWQIIGIPYHFHEETYIITAAAFDEYGYKQLKHKQNNSLALIIIFSLIIVGIGLVFAHYSLKPLRKMTNEISTIQISGLDQAITVGKLNDELKELAIIFNNLMARMHQSFRAQKEVVAHMSHEFRTPLAALMMEIELAKSKFDQDENLLETFNLLEQDALKMKNLSDGLMNLAKAQYDHSEVDKELFRMDELLLEAQTELLHSKTHYQIQVNYITFPQTPQSYEYYGNKYLIKLALLNLLDNACKYSNPHRCEVELSFEQQNIQLRFIDQGIGIKEEYLDHIFDAFYRINNTHVQEGFGIGLALTAQILQLHDATITIQSKLNIGTTITLIFSKY